MDRELKEEENVDLTFLFKCYSLRFRKPTINHKHLDTLGPMRLWKADVYV